ncbi:hypothetical protein E7Z53_17260 [Kocuria salina]|uniref:hypothetical protein n=1 Tax=Kocuria salina TaxID=1929416 RepID=UPI001594006B|nr:hypothetical protein [Kocuria salina]NVC25174.1 hypothetical protein [Kocuria salina]
MERQFSRILTAVTVVLLGALLLLMVLDRLIEVRLSPFLGPLGGLLGVLVVIRLLLNIRRPRSGVAAPVMDAASVQSRLFGFSPGTSRIADVGGPAYTTSKIHESPRREAGEEPL